MDCGGGEACPDHMCIHPIPWLCGGGKRGETNPATRNEYIPTYMPLPTRPPNLPYVHADPPTDHGRIKRRGKKKGGNKRKDPLLLLLLCLFSGEGREIIMCAVIRLCVGGRTGRRRTRRREHTSPGPDRHTYL